MGRKTLVQSYGSYGDMLNSSHFSLQYYTLSLREVPQHGTARSPIQTTQAEGKADQLIESWSDVQKVHTFEESHTVV